MIPTERLKKIVFNAALVLAAAALLQSPASQAQVPPVHSHSVAVNAAMASGGFSLGGEYEYMLDRMTGVGGYARFFTKDDDHSKPGGFVIGGQARVHYPLGRYDIFASPGVAIISVDGSGTKGDATTLGPSLNFGILYQLNDRFALGFDDSKYWVWFDKDWRGLLIDELAVHLRATF